MCINHIVASTLGISYISSTSRVILIKLTNAIQMLQEQINLQRMESRRFQEEMLKMVLSSRPVREDHTMGVGSDRMMGGPRGWTMGLPHHLS